MITWVGTHVTKEFGAPNIRDMAVQGMRLVRFSGAGRIFWPVGMHSLLVADLLPPELEHHGLLHDCAAEVCVSDVPRPMKTDAAREVEGIVATRTYYLLGVPLPTVEEAKLIHEADLKAAFAEEALGCAHPTTHLWQNGFERNLFAENRLASYLSSYGELDLDHPNFDVRWLLDLMRSDGRWPREFERRLVCALRRVQHTKYTEAA